MLRGDADDVCMCPWIASLPQHVHLPLFHYTEAELEACGDAGLVREALSIRESAEAVYEVHSSAPVPSALHLTFRSLVPQRAL